MDVEKEGRDFVIATLVGTPRQDVFRSVAKPDARLLEGIVIKRLWT